MQRFVSMAIFLLLISCGGGKGGDVAIDASSSRSDTVSAIAYEARQGEALFEHYCATCHGEYGRGDGFNSYNLDPKPRDLADSELQDQRTDEALASVIRLGGGAVGLSSGMPPWGQTLNDREVQYLVAFIRVLPERAEEPE